MPTKQQLKILDTDRFFTDSPDPGEPGCDCSRCHQPIAEGNMAIRVAVDREVVYTKGPDGKERKGVEACEGTEYRLCKPCYTKATQ